MSNFAGFHDPGNGGFAIFEIASAEATAPIPIQRGDLLFGHFANVTRDNRIVSQVGRLDIELIAWDPDKQFYNFYDFARGQWIYQGDSEGILKDLVHLRRSRTGTEVPIVDNVRCSSCHLNGGLLQKELAAPHNDWSAPDRKYDTSKLTPDPLVKGKIDSLVDPGELSKLVAASAQRLADSPRYQEVLRGRNMQERLRPLFCPMEVNIESDPSLFDDGKPTLRIPSAFFLDPRLGTVDISIDRRHYDAALARLRSTLPPGRRDADHGWLTPVKAHSDIVAVDNLIKQGIVTKQFVMAVLALDFTNPMISSRRCDLLKLVPHPAGPDFVGRFEDALRGSSLPGVGELLANLAIPDSTGTAHEPKTRAFLDSCRALASDAGAVLDWVRLLAQRPADVAESEISKGPHMRHILEEDRVIFPTMMPEAGAGKLKLTPSCRVE